MFLSKELCPAVKNKEEFLQSLRAVFPTIDGIPDLQASVQQLVLESLPVEKSISCGSAEMARLTRQLAEELVMNQITLGNSQLPPESMCKVTLPMEDSVVVYAGEDEAKLHSSDGKHIQSFTEINPAAGEVTLQDGPFQSQAFISNYATRSKPALLKGLARQQAGYRKWRDQYLVNRLASYITDSDQAMDAKLLELIHGEASPLNGTVPPELWGR